MSELFLVAHKVRGEAAFDVATKMECPECAIQFDDGVCDSPGCDECDGTGFWWIVPTSGHRAYPWWTVELAYLGTGCDYYIIPTEHHEGSVTSMPEGLPDHYPTRSAPTINAMEALLGSIAPARGGFRRRF